MYVNVIRKLLQAFFPIFYLDLISIYAIKNPATSLLRPTPHHHYLPNKDSRRVCCLWRWVWQDMGGGIQAPKDWNPMRC